MATFTWKGGDDVTSLPVSLRVGFYGAAFGDTIAIASYQQSNYATNTGAENSGSLPSVRYIPASGSSYAYWSGGSLGSGSGSTASMPSGAATVHINFSHTSSVNFQGAKFFAYDGSDPTNNSTTVSNKGFSAEPAVTTWVDCDIEEGYVNIGSSVSPLTEHNFYIAVSATPLSAGGHTDIAYRIEFEYY